uniref:Disease resistance R13L4/SHOC-2-like LRR domain-containing protein n=1 Tax=Anopheles christyi TaxID=43041 RepID=A0A182KGN9_9DIPT
MSNQPVVSCLPVTANKMSKAKKVLDEARETKNREIDLVDRNISTFEELPGLPVPPGIANLNNLEILNLSNNHLEELPLSLSSMPKLRILNCSINRLNTLPRGFGAFPVLEVLDLSYNNLNEHVLPGNFFMMDSLRALYLGDNEFEYLPKEIKNLKNLQILGLRDNDLLELPREIGELTRIRELHIQNNRLSVLPPEIANLDMPGPKSVLKMEENPWVTAIAEQYLVGISHVLEYIKTEAYRILYNRHMQSGGKTAGDLPPKADKSKKASRARS